MNPFSSMNAREIWWNVMPNLYFCEFRLKNEDEFAMRDALALVCAEHINQLINQK